VYCRLDAHTVRIKVKRSLETKLPGVKFAPIIEVTNNKDDTEMKVRLLLCCLRPHCRFLLSNQPVKHLLCSSYMNQLRQHSS
jgi:hypothetical protein